MSAKLRSLGSVVFMSLALCLSVVGVGVFASPAAADDGTTTTEVIIDVEAFGICIGAYPSYCVKVCTSGCSGNLGACGCPF